MANYLLELGMEEIPARFLKDLSQQLEDRLQAYLDDHQLGYDKLESFATPRRLAVRVMNLADKQADIQEKVKGPALKIAKDDQGQWTKAALGFLRGQGCTVEDIIVEDLKGTDYIFVDKHIPGKSAQEVLQDLPQVLSQMTFPVSMHWHSFEESFIRPVHWIVSLLNDQVIDFEFLHVKTGRQSRGHRFLGHDVDIKDPMTYEDQLEEVFVLANFAHRQAEIERQIQAIAEAEDWLVPMDPDLLEEVTAIVEWPTAFFGQFDQKYLEIPAMITVTAMKDHQRYFYVQDKVSQDLLPYFISVRNGDSHAIENVIQGNLKVLRARLEDALFFYQEDLKQDLAFYVGKLDKVNEHFKLGSLADKQKRVARNVEGLAQALPALSSQDLETSRRASQIYKFDLMTGVVDEFSELQGQIGGIYAKEFGESDQVAQAIATQYYPAFAGGPLPDTRAGALLAVADKLDSLVEYFKVGLIPTGSNDPYALRRQAMGLVEIILDQAWSLDLVPVISVLQGLELENQEPDWLGQVITFINARMNQFMAKDGIDYDIIEAVLTDDSLKLNQIYQSAKALQTIKNDDPESYRQVVENMTRIVNLGRDVSSQAEVQTNILETDSEKDLVNLVQELPQSQDLMEIYQIFKDNLATIIAYFENNMVNHQDPAIKANRLLTLGHLSQFILQAFDPSKLISKF